MSDYLWDKTGEPDEEVERLEALLAPFAHEPRALELPATATPRASLNRRAWLAVAAAVLLATLAGALVALRQPEGQDSQQAASQAPPPAPSPNVAAPVAPAPWVKDERVALSSPAVTPRRRQVRAAAKVGQTARVGKVKKVEAEEGGRAEVAASLARGFSVKAQLVNALRLTGTKLKEVQQKTLGSESAFGAERGRSR